MNELKICAAAAAAPKVLTKKVEYMNLYHAEDTLIGGTYNTLDRAISGRSRGASEGVLLSITRDTNGDFTCKIERTYL